VTHNAKTASGKRAWTASEHRCVHRHWHLRDPWVKWPAACACSADLQPIKLDRMCDDGVKLTRNSGTLLGSPLIPIRWSGVCFRVDPVLGWLNLGIHACMLL
jgi:hypothetical protein